MEMEDGIQRYIRVLINSNNNSYIALYPVKKNQARGAVHYQHQNPLDNQKKHKYYKCIHQYQNDKKSQDETNKKQKQKREEEAQVL